MTHMAVDQYGQYEHNLGPHPRAELLRRLGRKRAERMFVDRKNGATLHIGWIVAGRWFTVYRVERMERPMSNPHQNLPGRNTLEE